MVHSLAMTNSDKEKEYRLVFPGRVLAGTDEEEVIRSLARLLNTSSEIAQRLIAGKRRYIKRIFSYEEAIRIRIQILKIGVECELVAVDPSNLALKPKKKNVHNSPFPEPEGFTLEAGDGEAIAAHEQSYGETMEELQECKERNIYQ